MDISIMVFGCIVLVLRAAAFDVEDEDDYHSANMRFKLFWGGVFRRIFFCNRIGKKQQPMPGENTKPAIEQQHEEPSPKDAVVEET